MGEALEFRVFGAPEVRRGTEALAVGHARQLSVLAVLSEAAEVSPADGVLSI